MAETSTTKSFLIYIPPSQEVSNLLEKVNQELRTNHPYNTYLPLYKEKYHSHLMVYLSPMPSANQNQIIEAVSTIVKTLSVFKVELSDLEIADSNYLYVTINSKTKLVLESIHNKLVELLKSYRDTNIKDKYLQKWDSFSEDEKYRIKATGLPYIYVPHLTLGIFKDREDQKAAYNEALPFNLTGHSFTANRIEILTSVGSDYKDKEIIFSEMFPE